ncbi:hypothetical protein ACH5RR_011541 [Cinchona calisaya]|uniref:Uncharacterized protein n=1 Tax=Cinchona calisaya TaxID=153742 RepID=A0ABD3A8N1_9GENT
MRDYLSRTVECYFLHLQNSHSSCKSQVYKESVNREEALELLAGMALILLAAAVGGLGRCISTIWGLLELRFDVVFEAISNGARSFTAALMVCFLMAYQRRSELGVAFL